MHRHQNRHEPDAVTLVLQIRIGAAIGKVLDTICSLCGITHERLRTRGGVSSRSRLPLYVLRSSCRLTGPLLVRLGSPPASSTRLINTRVALLAICPASSPLCPSTWWFYPAAALTGVGEGSAAGKYHKANSYAMRDVQASRITYTCENVTDLDAGAIINVAFL